MTNTAQELDLNYTAQPTDDLILLARDSRSHYSFSHDHLTGSCPRCGATICCCSDEEIDAGGPSF